MSDREHAQVRIDIDVVRALLDGVLATPCHFIRMPSAHAGWPPVRQCIRHYAPDPCPVGELRRVRKEYDEVSADIVREQHEDWLASSEADPT